MIINKGGKEKIVKYDKDAESLGTLSFVNSLKDFLRRYHTFCPNDFDFIGYLFSATIRVKKFVKIEDATSFYQMEIHE